MAGSAGWCRDGSCGVGWPPTEWRREARPADVLIEDGTIVAVGPDAGQGADAEVLDLAAGSVVCPGFIDAHVHAEGRWSPTGWWSGRSHRA